MPPSLLEAWKDDLKATWKYNKIHVLPWRIAMCAAVGLIVSFHVESVFFYPRLWGVSVSVFSGFLTFNAITLALAWSGIGRIYDTLSVPKFSNFLKETGALNRYHFILAFINRVQIFAALITIASLCVLLYGGILIFWDRIMLGATIGSTLYALWWANSATTVARDLSWQYATFDGLSDEEIQRIRLAVDNSDAA